MANKVIVILDGEPMRNGISVITGTETRSEWSAGNADKIQVAVEHGVSAVLIIDSSFSCAWTMKDGGDGSIMAAWNSRRAIRKGPAQSLFISRAMADDCWEANWLLQKSRSIKKGSHVHL